MGFGATKLWLNSLFIGQVGEVPPVHGEVLKLVGVNSYKNQHGVSNHKPPEGLQEFPPETVVNLQKKLGAEEGRGKRLVIFTLWYNSSPLLYWFKRPQEVS